MRNAHFSKSSVCRWALLVTLLTCGLANRSTSAAEQPTAPTPGKKTPQAATAINRFASDLHGKLADDRNQVVSPASISTAIAMAYSGSKGKTATQIADTLHFKSPPDKLASAFAALQPGKVLPSGDQPSTRLEMVNAIWGQTGYPFSKKYLKTLQDGYRASANELDFRGSPRDSCNVINKWIEQKTHGRIEKLLTEDAVSSNSRLVLTNTLYFKGLWVSPFPDKPATLQWKTGDETKPVPSMSQTTSVSYKENDLFQAVELPYQDSRLAMVILLPKPEISWQQFCSTLRTSGFTKALTGFEPKRAVITLPKFSISTRLSLEEILSPTMPLAFSDEADFSPMVDGESNLKISAVIHQAFIDVDNIGTEAGAATAVSIVLKSARPAVVFKADRPFVFALLDRDSRAIFFLGHLIQP